MKKTCKIILFEFKHTTTYGVVRNCCQKIEAYEKQENIMNNIINDFVSILSREQFRLYLKVWHEICEMRKIEVDEYIKVTNKLFVDMFK